MLLSSLSPVDKLSVGGTTTLLGLGMTFVVLALLIGCVYLVNTLIKLSGKFLTEYQAKKKAKKEAEVKAETVVPAVVEDSVDKKADGEIDEETMIAIRSAVETFVRESSADGKPHENVTVLSVKEI